MKYTKVETGWDLLSVADNTIVRTYKSAIKTNRLKTILAFKKV